MQTVPSVRVVGVEEGGDGPVYDVMPLSTEGDVGIAVSSGQEIWSIDPATSVIEERLFDGSRWVSDLRPEVIPDEEPVPVPLVSYVDQRVETLQAEVEALTDALLEVDPANARALFVRDCVPDVRAAIEVDDPEAMDQIIGSLRATPVRQEA